MKYSRENRSTEPKDEIVSQPLLITIPEVAKRLNLGRTKVYELIWREHLPVQKLGILWLFPRKDRDPICKHS